MADKTPNKVQEELAKKNVDQSSKKLAFDPATGELIVKNQEDVTQNPDEVLVDQIYKDGFFNTLS